MSLDRPGRPLSQKEAVMASILAATAAPFVAAGEPKQEALERALDLVEAAVAFIESQRAVVASIESQRERR